MTVIFGKVVSNSRRLLHYFSPPQKQLCLIKISSIYQRCRLNLFFSPPDLLIKLLYVIKKLFVAGAGRRGF